MQKKNFNKYNAYFFANSPNLWGRVVKRLDAKKKVSVMLSQSKTCLIAEILRKHECEDLYKKPPYFFLLYYLKPYWRKCPLYKRSCNYKQHLVLEEVSPTFAEPQSYSAVQSEQVTWREIYGIGQVDGISACQVHWICVKSFFEKPRASQLFIRWIHFVIQQEKTCFFKYRKPPTCDFHHREWDSCYVQHEFLTYYVPSLTNNRVFL